MSRVKDETEFGPKRTTGCGFADTRWSQVLLAAQTGSAKSGEALERLCTTYWWSIYSFLRRKGHQPHDAEDLTQQFFVRFLEKGSLAGADPAKGRFRSFLLGALGYFLVDEARRSSAKKRGGGQEFLSIDLSEAEGLLEGPDSSLSPEEVYDRRWAATLLDQAYRRLRAEFQAADQLPKFECLRPFLSGEVGGGCYETAAEQLGITKRAVTVAVYRMRQRYRQLVRLEVADTVAVGEDVDKELRDLFA